MQLNVAGANCRKIIHCALVYVACDLPADRKVCGYLGHNTHLGCSLCYKKFSGSVGTMDFSGFDRKNWVDRSGSKHSIDACSIFALKTKVDRCKKESELDCRYSVFLMLPYFDAPRMLIVDPMHSLF